MALSFWEASRQFSPAPDVYGANRDLGTLRNLAHRNVGIHFQPISITGTADLTKSDVAIEWPLLFCVLHQAESQGTRTIHARCHQQ